MFTCTKKALSMFLAVSLLTAGLCAPSGAWADYEDNSDDLPGQEDNSKTLKTVLIVGGVVLAVTAVSAGIYVYNKNKKAKAQENAAIGAINTRPLTACPKVTTKSYVPLLYLDENKLFKSKSYGVGFMKGF